MGSYRVFGFGLRSELVLPELTGDAAADGGAVTVRLGDAPRPDGMVAIAEGVAAGPAAFWMEVPDVARILARAGAEIVVEPAPGADESVVRAFLLGSAMGALLHQRGLLPLHASAVRMGDGAVAFTGASGAGKSTVALHLADRGHPPVSDDICALEIVDGVPRLHPGPRRMKLWLGSLAATGRRADGLGRVLPTLDKYQLPLPAESGGAIPLRAVFVLDRGAAAEASPLPLPVATGALIANTFRGELVAPMDRRRAHFDQCLAVARAARLLRLRRAWSLDRLDHAAEAIERAAGRIN